MKWEKVKLSDVTESCLGKMLDQNKNIGTYKPYLANINVRWGEFDLENLPLMRFEDREEDRYGLKSGDIVLCEGGEPGRCAIWKDLIPNMKFQKALHRIRVNREMDCYYLYYWFLMAGRAKILDQYFTGSTIKHLPSIKLKEIVIDKPPLEIQKHIGSILSTYDDLIENNQKQIKLLEEAAQRLYKEWFVDLRFPGHENVKIVDGVPEGWSKSKVGLLIGGIKRNRKVKTAEYCKEGIIPVIDQGENFIGGYIDDESALIKIKEPVIVFGDHTRRLKLVQFDFASGADGTQLISALIPEMAFRLLYCSLQNIDLSNYSYARHFKYLKEEIIVVPSVKVASMFERISTDLFDKIQKSRDEITVLQEARDRLLPKLMSGEIEV